jgi:hypothetical protein
MKSTMIKEIRNYSVVEDRLFYESNSKEFFINGELLYSNVLGHSTFQRNVVVTLETSENKNNSILIFNGIIKKFEFSINPIYVSSKFIFVRHEISSERKKWSYFLFDSINEKVTFYSNNYHCLAYPCLFDENLFSVNENLIIISNLDLPTETTLWQYSVADLGAEKVSKILGVFGETLVVVGQIKENTFVLFGLDVQSGQLQWKHDTVFERNSDGRISRVKLNLPYADTTSNKIIIFEAGFYIEIEGSSGQIIKWIDVFKSPFHYNDLTMDAYAFDISQADDDHIYFRTSVPAYGMYTGAGIFNRKTDKLEFLEVIKNEKGNPVIIGPLKIHATKEKYYVLDIQNTLHIFEREDEIPDLNQ